jgi:hypothetical protein
MKQIMIKWVDANPPGKVGGTTLLVQVDGNSEAIREALFSLTY